MTSRLNPDVFDSLAALSRFLDVQECAPSFYERHKDGVDIAVRTVRHLIEGKPDLRTILVFTGAPVSATVSALRGWCQTARVPDADIAAMGRYVQIATRAVFPVFGDPKLPTFLKQCRWGIEDAFAENRKTARQVPVQPELRTA